MMKSGSRVFTLLVLIAYASAYDYRLKKNVVPLSYSITIKPYMLAEDGNKQHTFEGDVVINLKAIEPYMQEIIVHQALLKINKAWLNDDNGDFIEELESNTFIYDHVTEKLTIPLSDFLMVNVEYQLRISYVGKILDNLTGFYHGNYTDAKGDLKWLGLTQLQRVDARTVFPCFDEPEFKATFQLHISRPRQYKVLSNTRLLRTEYDGENRYLDHFEVTPVMSTYLVAFFICEYISRGNEDFAVFSRKEYYNYTELLYEAGLKSMEAFDKLFKLPYVQLGNPIMQFISAPQFVHNGMENWGLVYFNDQIAIRIPNYTDSWREKEETIRVVVHEMAHMWFGNSVTLAWWNVFWLNEGFARYYEYSMAHKLYPEYHLDQQFIVNHIHSVLDFDSTSSTQPLTSVEETVNSPHDISNKLNRITYSKGAAVLHMIRNAMGAENFDEAISSYLRENHLQNVKPSDLFFYLKKHWPKEQDVNLDLFFYDWTEQPGYPVVFVNTTHNHTQVVLTQKRYLIPSAAHRDNKLTYTIPITYATNLYPDFKNLTPTTYFGNTDRYAKLEFKESIKWIVINLKHSNFHRVYYDIPLLKELQRALSVPGHSHIAVENRAQILDDLLTFGKMSDIDFEDVFQLMEYLAIETEYLPWYAVFVGLSQVAERFTVEELEDFSKYLSDITQKVYAKLGFQRDNDSVLDVYNRNNLIAWLCKYKHQDCNAQALLMFNKMNAGVIEKPAPDFREVFYCCAARAGAYSELVKWYENETLASEREKLWHGISCTKDFKTHYEQQIHNPATPVELKNSGIKYMYKENPENVTPIFKLLSKDIPRLVKTFGEKNASMIITYITDEFTTDYQLHLLIEFINNEGSGLGGSLYLVKSTIRTVDIHLKWQDDRLPRVAKYLKNRNCAAVNNIAITIFLLLSLGHFVHFIHLA